MKTAYTPGPLTVAVEEKFPFDIVTTNAAGAEVFRRGMPAHSTLQKTVAQCLAGEMMPHEWREMAADDNARAIANETLRAAAPLLAEALVAFVRALPVGVDHKADSTITRGIEITLGDLRRAAVALRAAGVEVGE